jgi:hypothetical protein
MPKATNPSLLARSSKMLTKFVLSLFTRQPYSALKLTPGHIRLNAIEAKGLVKQFEGFHEADGVDLKIPEGSIFGIMR